MSHALERTSPKGGPFIGRCMKCGLTEIPLTKMHEPCPNPANFSNGEVLLRAITGALQEKDGE